MILLSIKLTINYNKKYYLNTYKNGRMSNFKNNNF